MIVSLIAALDEAGGIGYRQGLPWRLPADLRRFKRLTMGHYLICGRRTYETIARPLPGRTLIVLTRQPGYAASGCLVAAALEQALHIAALAGESEAFVIGGAAVYTAALPQAERLYLTRVHAVLPADTFFPLFDPRQWQVTERQFLPSDDTNPYDTTFERLDRKRGEPFREPDNRQS